MNVKELFKQFEKEDNAYMYLKDKDIIIEKVDCIIPTIKIYWNGKVRKLYKVNIHRNSNKCVVMFMMKEHIFKHYKEDNWEIKHWQRGI